jgi:hypothetical protein
MHVDGETATEAGVGNASRLEAALGYAARGWRVLPIHSVRNGQCTCATGDCPGPGKHPRTEHGVKDATLEQNQISAWWANWPDANVAIATGPESGIFVIDVDAANDGFESLNRYEEDDDGCPLGGTLTAVTGGGGQHIFFEHPRDGLPLKSRTGWLPGIDVHADGGYVVVAPSVHKSGQHYAWFDATTPVATAPWSAGLSNAHHREFTLVDDLRRTQTGVLLQPGEELPGSHPRLVTAAERRSRPPMTWTVDQIMSKWGVGQLFGATYVGKTFVTIDLALRVCNADVEGVKDWFAHPILRGGPVVYILMEGSYDFQDRVQAWLNAHPGTSDEALYTVEEDAIDLRDPASLALLSAAISSTEVDPVVVVVDTQSLATPGTDENSNTEMNQVFSNLKRFAKDHNCFVLLVHHTGHDQTRARGASAQKAALDLEIEVGDGRLQAKKVKAGKPSAQYAFRITEAGLSAYVDGSQWPALVQWQAERETRDAEFRHKIEEVLAEESGLTDGALRKRVGGGSQTVTQALRRLAEEGRIVDDGGGGRGRRHSWRLTPQAAQPPTS